MLLLTCLALLASTIGARPAQAAPTVSGAPPAYHLFLPLVVSPEQPLGPLDVAVALDAGRAVSQTVGAGGGVLTATTASGAHLTLAIPAHALFSDEDITLTPLAAMTGTLMSGGLLAGVQLAPDGLVFARPATLTLTLPAAVPVAEQIAFSYHGAGADFHLDPDEPAPSTVVMVITHFSGRGVGRGTAADRARIRQHKPSQPVDQAEQDLAGAPAPDTTVLTQWFTEQVVPQLVRARSDETWMDVALSSFLTWYGRVLQRNAEGALQAQANFAYDALATGVQNAVDKAFQKCVSQNDPEQVGPILRWLDWALNVEQVASRIGASGLNSMRDKVQKCARFELQLDSVVDYSYDGLNWSGHVTARVLIDYAALAQSPVAITALNYQSFSLTDPSQQCSLSFAEVDGVLTVTSLRLGRNLGVITVPPKLGLALTGMPVENLTIHCPKGSQTLSLHYWGLGWQHYHLIVPDDSCCYGLVLWDRGTGSLYAYRNYDVPDDKGALHDKVKLVHMPLP